MSDSSRDIHGPITAQPAQLTDKKSEDKQDANNGAADKAEKTAVDEAETLLELPSVYSGAGDPPPDALNFFYFFGGLFTQDEQERRHALQQIMQTLRAAVLSNSSHSESKSEESGDESEVAGADGSASDVKDPDLDSLLRDLSVEHRQAVECHGLDLVHAHLPTLMRLSVACPFERVHEEANSFLKFCQSHGVELPVLPASMRNRGPSYFFAAHAAPAVNSKAAAQLAEAASRKSSVGPVGSPASSPCALVDPQSPSPPVVETSPEVSLHSFPVNQVFQDSFLQVGRLSHLQQIMGWHPTFLTLLNDTMTFIMREHGPLPDHWRHYIAIMAAGRYHCEYLILQQADEFLAVGGTREWLSGLSFAPPKLQALAELNALLAHQPWRITKEHVKTLDEEFGWSNGELIHAMIIMCSYHALASVAYGLGVTPEVDVQVAIGQAAETADQSLADAKVMALEHESDEKGSDQETESLFQILQSATAAGDKASSRATTEKSGTSDDGSNIDEFARAGPSDCTEEKTPKKARSARRGHKQHFKLPDFTSCGSSVLDAMVYEDFDVKSSVYKVFRTNEYNWKQHGLELIKMSYDGVGAILDKEFEHIFHMTYRTFNEKKNVDTRPFRRGLWYYVQRLYGVCYDDYNYEEVNTVLNRTIKEYVKKVSCHPERLDYDDFNQCGLTLFSSEKCHIALLSAEAHKLASLLYGLHAIMEHTTKQ